VIGDKNAASRPGVTFWGARWSKTDNLSGGAARASFKGFEDRSATARCGGDRLELDHQERATISGDTRSWVARTAAGYAANPWHAGTGRVVAAIC